MTKLTTAPRDVFQTFMNFPLVEDLDALKADVAIIGMPYGSPYTIDELAARLAAHQPRARPL